MVNKKYKMKKILIGLFKRLVCLPILIIGFILVVITVYIGIWFIYWIITGRSIWEDLGKLGNYIFD